MKNVMLAVGFFALGFAAEAALHWGIAAYRSRRRARRLSDEQEALRHARETQESFVEEKRVQLARIRHDFQNQLAVAYRLTEQGAQGKARELLDGVRRQLEDSQEYKYCGNSIVNAVFLEREERFQSLGLRMQLELEICEEPGIEAVHLCSVFSNLLDNAILAVEKVPREQRFLSMHASQNGDYLHVKVENSALREKNGENRRHGYGQEILKEIARLYQGEFWTRREEEVYLACISLLTKR